MGACDSSKTKSNQTNASDSVNISPNNSIISLNKSNSKSLNKINASASTNIPLNNSIISLNKSKSSDQDNFLSFEEAKEFLKFCKVSTSILDDKGTTKTGWRVGKKNGPPGYLKDYIPPIGWTGIGLKVINLYDSGNNAWIGTKNIPGEWYIGYHGTKTVEAIQNICNDGFRRGERQQYKFSPNINPLTNISTPSCGEGVYFTPDIEEAKTYSDPPIFYNNYNYRVVFMCRINPYSVRIADIGNNKEYWIVEGDKLGDLNGKKRSDVVRPYRILFLKEIIKSDNPNSNNTNFITNNIKNSNLAINNINKPNLIMNNINNSKMPINNIKYINLTISEAKDFLINKCNITPFILDSQGDADTGWRNNQKSGPPGYLKDYIPPIGWTGIGLKVINIYDNGDNEWMGTNNSPGEWYIGYHGIRTIDSIQKIYNEGFRRGTRQFHIKFPNTNPLTNSQYPLCGEGAYFMPDIEDAKSNTSPFYYNGFNYAVILMCRINPYKVRIADIGNNKEFWIVEADKLGDPSGIKRTEEVRPYRILESKTT